MATSHDAALALAGRLAEHRAGDALILDLSRQAGWTDWFVIATGTSVTHLRGLARQVQDFAAERSLPARGGSRIDDEEEWVLVDLGDIVVHLMSARARAFYELEKLWFQAEAIAVPAPLPSPTAPSGPQSSPED